MPTPRRTLLQGLLLAYAAGRLPAALAGPAEPQALAAFMTLSAWLTGRDWLDPAQGRPLFEALTAQSGDFPTRCQALWLDVQGRHLDPATVHRQLSDEGSPLAALPRQIAKAWWQGVVGQGAQARCVAYEQALNAQVVADVLVPPSYAYGAHGSWSAPVEA
ncbi:MULTISPECIES: sugar dehydrogenase complex small subunit [unclassified Pseudomonas]|uniref:sugar dehydrogenase complex small subunit n=1 Tax=unclassified Pseudomonas TaxID=196821 RepID=UPI000BCAA2A1|nr:MULTISPECIES: sugar dehydrogenase complex small subunit [unclassified Pseudomonas]PVZ19623.1 D-sorbitol dehydrogenase-like protein [Pseudomonas sp. URIL14HWK12:I12]PVZ22792.1 D-sorbitol dehydrogenase-like protein [Pseudomonas sp. URIL14HWK12:I10]PVZ37578.1 D-sorbitol dehydrogenase-like protein [Pseudomonas sp. URIL14HWK12:I11]SNZ15163.1 Membrane bound FAD containing D-sorbitol dehydrogenase [Pseudomonas sp. URIL14HWK12:I9]